jgi:hypothetical protein
VGTKYLLAALLAALWGFPLFAYAPGDLVLNPEIQLGFEIPTIRQNAGYPEGKEDGSYVSLGLCWAFRLSLYYRWTSFLSAGAGVGLEGVYNQYNFTYYNPQAAVKDSYTERYTYDTYYFVMPAGFRVHIQALSLGLGLAGYIPLSAEFSGDIKQDEVYLSVTDDNFKAYPFLGGYFDIGYDWAEKAGSQGFNMNLRVTASFSDRIAGGNADYETFRHVAISLTAGYSFRAFSFGQTQ